MIKEIELFFAPTTWNNRHSETADNLERTNHSSIPLARHLKVECARQWKYFRILNIFFSLKEKEENLLILNNFFH